MGSPGKGKPIQVQIFTSSVYFEIMNTLNKKAVSDRWENNPGLYRVFSGRFNYPCHVALG